MTHPDPTMSAVPSSRAVRWGLFLAVWTVPALIFAVLSHGRMVAIGEQSSLWVWLGDHLVAWYAWAAFSPLIVWLGRRFRIDRAPFLTAISIHLTAGAVIAVIHSAVATYASVILHGEPRTMSYFLSQYVPYLTWRSPWSLVVYWIVLAVTYAFDYYARARDQQLRAAQLQSQISRAQMEALQQKLHPHFLFNTLNSISVLMQKGNMADSITMLNALSDLLRQVLAHNGQSLTSFGDELDFVRRYLEIEQMRFGPRLHLAYEVDEDTLAAPFPSFLLQLLAENAIRHGIAAKAGEGHLSIKAVRENGRLRVTVEDDGVGMDAVRDGGLPAGLGIRSAHQRLAVLYGDRYRLELSRRQPNGVTAVLEIPIRQ